MTPEMITRINELSQKSREGSLTEAEQTEQAHLRRLYIDNAKQQVKEQLEARKAALHSDDCSCGCHQHKHE
jgi:uncharacterized protein YnzC (UPF0291/DUF896 family)